MESKYKFVMKMQFLLFVLFSLIPLVLQFFIENEEAVIDLNYIIIINTIIFLANEII